MKTQKLKRVKIIGAGSIGNHLAHAARRLGCDVVVCDLSRAALDRMRDQIYPARYGAWDEGIQLFEADTAPRGGFDLICVGTPPPSHISLALQALKEAPLALQIEKPLCPPDLNQASQLASAIKSGSTKVFVGYDHVVGKAASKVEELLRSGLVGQVQTLDVEFREHWGGIFKAHPWLDGPADSYLGFFEMGGGASGEHSHALNLWQHFAHITGNGRVAEVSATLKYVREGKAFYDSLCLLNLCAESGLVGRVVQDVVTVPSRKVAFVQGTEGNIQWINNYTSKSDAVVINRKTAGEPELTEFPKTRPEDFIEEIKHMNEVLAHGTASPIAFERGLETMKVLKAAHQSQQSQQRVHIDWSEQMVP